MAKQAQLAVAIALFAAVSSGEQIAQLLTNQPAMLDLLKKEPIHAAVQGRIPSLFRDVARSFEGTNLLVEVDAAYGRLLPPGQKPAFELRAGTSNVYYYLSREGKRSDITEVCRGRTAANELSAVYYVTGRRFFGSFRSLIHITVSNAPPEGVAYAVDVYGYPETAFTRFLIHRLHLVENYFRSHAVIITRLIENIGKELCRPREHDGAVRVAALGRTALDLRSQRRKSVMSGGQRPPLQERCGVHVAAISDRRCPDAGRASAPARPESSAGMARLGEGWKPAATPNTPA